ncbi:MAG: ABC transporter substrate-binding protein [Trueperaceae bacterium]
MNRTRLARTILVALTALAVAFAGTAAAQSTSVPQGGTLTIAWPEAVNNLDLAYIAGWVAFGAAHHLTDPLILLDAEGQPQPSLAQSWEVSDDNMVYTLHLRDDVTFHDGVRFDAEAVRANIQRTLDDPDTMQHERFTNTIGSVEVVDDFTVRITLKELDASFLHDVLAHWQVRPISPADIPNRSAATMTEGYAGTGPFKFESFVADDSFVVVKNENYWRGAPNIDRVVFRFLPELSVHTVELLAGSVDVSTSPILDDVPLLEARGLQIVTAPAVGVNMLTMNVSRGFTAELAVRQAIRHAVNRQEIVDSVLGGFPSLSRAGVPEGTALYSESVSTVEYDPELAGRILDEAGWLMGADGVRYRDGVALRPQFLNPPGAHAANAEIVQEQLRLVGIDTRFEVAEGGTYGPRWREGDYELSMTAQGGTNWGSFIGGSVHPDDFWTVNQIRFSEDPELLAVADELREIIAEARSTVDLEERRAAWARGQQLFQDYALTYWLWHAPTVTALQPWVKGYDFYTRTLFLHDAYIER